MLDFFKELKENNSKEWFEMHRTDYDKYVKHPSEDFVAAMGEKLKTLSPDIHAIPKINQSLFRLNKDIRFSKDKSPYKTNLGILFWEGKKKRMESSGFYFHLENNMLMLGAGIHIFSKALLQKYREAVVDKKSGEKLNSTVNALSAKGILIGEKHYKRVPRGYDPFHKHAEFLLFKGLTARIEIPAPKELFSNTILEYTFTRFKQLQPIHEWLLHAVG